MSASHGIDAAESSAPRDEHYTNEHSSRRRRLRTDTPEPSFQRIRYPGDGLDYRRPVLSSAGNGTRDGSQVNGRHEGAAGEGNVRTHATVIDLTDDDFTEESQTSERPAPAPVRPAPAASSRAQRLPRFDRNIIDVEGVDDDEDLENNTSTRNLPGANYLALPPRTAAGTWTRPQFSSLRRPTRPPSPPAEMDEVEFVEARPRRGARIRQPSPRYMRPPHRLRSLTPYPDGLSEEGVIDLTAEEDDDDVVLLNSRRREGSDNSNDGGANAARPYSAVRDLRLMGPVAERLRDQGFEMGSRLLDRLQGMVRYEAAVNQPPPARDHTNQNHSGHRHHHHHRAANLHHHHRRNEAPRGFGNIRPGGIDIVMDHAMVGFDLGLEGGNRPPTPKYSPPPEPEAGFTRAPKEDEEVVCPNCGDELAVGEGEAKQEIWVVKACGHVRSTCVFMVVD